MTTNEYLARLKSCLECIDASEREAAVQFYTEYFEDAGEENAEKVMAELGSPEKLARDIIKQSAGSAPTSPAAETAACGEAFTGIHAETINAKLILLRGNEYRVDLDFPEGLKKPAVSIRDGVLRIEEKPTPKHFTSIFDGSFWSGAFGGRNAWRQSVIAITVPDVQFEDFWLETVNGTIDITKSASGDAAALPALRLSSLKCEAVNGTINVEGVSANKIHLENVNGSTNATNCTATAGCHCETVNGSVKLTGGVRGNVHLESVNGSVAFNTTEKLEQFNCEFDTMSGSVYINGEKQSRKHTTVISDAAESKLKAETMNGSIRANFAV